MKKSILLLFILSISLIACAQQRPPYPRFTASQVVQDYALNARDYLSIPRGSTASFPSYVMDANKCGALYWVIVPGQVDVLYTYDCNSNSWIKVSPSVADSVGTNKLNVVNNGHIGGNLTVDGTVSSIGNISTNGTITGQVGNFGTGGFGGNVSFYDQIQSLKEIRINNHSTAGNDYFIKNGEESVGTTASLKFSLGTPSNSIGIKFIGNDIYDLAGNKFLKSGSGGSVGSADSLAHQASTYYLNRSNHTGSQAESTVTNLTTDLAAKLSRTFQSAQTITQNGYDFTIAGGTNNYLVNHYDSNGDFYQQAMSSAQNTLQATNVLTGNQVVVGAKIGGSRNPYAEFRYTVGGQETSLHINLVADSGVMVHDYKGIGLSADGSVDTAKMAGNVYVTAKKVAGMLGAKSLSSLLLTGYVTAAGTVSATDNALQAFQKVVGNINNNTTSITTLQGQHTSDYAAIGLKHSKIISANPTAPSSTIASGDSTNMAVWKLQAQINTNSTAITSKQAAISGTGYGKWAGSSLSFIPSIPNTDLANSSMLFNGTSVALGGSYTLSSLTNGFGIKALSFNGSSATNVIVDTTKVSTIKGVVDTLNAHGATIGAGLANSSNTLSVDQTYAFAWTNKHTFNFADASSSGSSNYGISIISALSQTATAGWTDININRTGTPGSGPQYFINLSVGGTSKFSVNSSGFLTSSAGINLSGSVTAGIYSQTSTSFDGFYMQNFAPATSGVPSIISPRYNLATNVWNTTTSHSDAVNFIQEVSPVSGATPGYKYNWSGRVNASGTGAFSQLMSLDNNGVLTLASLTTGIPKVTSGALGMAVAGTDFQGPISLTTTGSTGPATFNSSTGALNIPNYAGSAGTVTNVASGNGLTGGPITNTGTLSVDQTFAFNWTGKHTWSISDASSSGSTNYGISMTDALSQTGAAAFTDFNINRTGTAGTGTQNFVNFSVAGTSKFSVSNTGQILSSAGFNGGNITSGSFNNSVNSSVNMIFLTNYANADATHTSLYSPNQINNYTVWNTSGTPAVNYVNWKQEARSLSGTAPTISYVWSSSLSTTTTASYTDRMTLDGLGNLTVGKSIRPTPVTFANVPTSPVEGMMIPITDSTTATPGATITGTGTNHVMGYWNGTNWIAL